MLAFGLHFAYLRKHNVTSIILLGLAWLVQMQASHISGWCTFALSVPNNLHYINRVLTIG